MLRQLGPDLWVAERPFTWNNIDVGGKMAVVRLQEGGLWIHSPVDLTPELQVGPFMPREILIFGRSIGTRGHPESPLVSP